MNPRPLSFHVVAFLLFAVVLPTSAQNKNLPPCSMQKVNSDCELRFDRLDMVTPPTIQMRPDARVKVVVYDPLMYETLSLDPTTFQGISPSDQTQAFLTALLPSLKGVSAPTTTYAAAFAYDASATGNLLDVGKDLKALADALDNPFPSVYEFVSNSRYFYAQVQEVVAPLPRPRKNKDKTKDDPIRAAAATDSPIPWSAYPDWRTFVLCELTATECGSGKQPNFKDLMATGITVQGSLTPPPPPAKPGTNPPLGFDSAAFDKVVARTKLDIAKLDPGDQQPYYAKLATLQAQEQALVNLAPTYAAAWLPAVTAINKDLQAYYVNIKETPGVKPTDPADPKKTVDYTDLGFIDDPRLLSGTAVVTTRFLGRQVTYALDSVNSIAVMTTAVPTTAQKTALVTITILYADPIFEVSTGAIISSLPNRSFSNVTLVPSVTPPVTTAGNIVIAQTKTQPIVLPYVAANFRIGPNFTLAGRRSAVYFTTGVAFNGYNTTAEYVAGLSLSWRMIMISPLFHLGHDTHLTQNETVGMVWCSTNKNDPNFCNGFTPPAPTSTTYWRGAFAVGIGIRIPTSFGTTVGR
jgi:hypothetical protein